jgi:hypothetical protein
MGTTYDEIQDREKIDDFKNAFDQLIKEITPAQQRMLKAHLELRYISTTDLAKAAGYASYSAANLQYGKLAFKLKKHLKHHVDNTHRLKDGSEIGISIIAESTNEHDKEEFQLWRMYGYVAVALHELKLCDIINSLHTAMLEKKLLWYWMKLAHKTKKLADTINCENNELDEIRGSIHNLCGTIDSVGCVQLAPINNYIVDEYLEQSIENGIELYKSQNWQLED